MELWLPGNQGNGGRKLGLATDLHGGWGEGGKKGNNDTTNVLLIPPQLLNSGQNQSGGVDGSGTGTSTSGTQLPTGSGHLTTSPIYIPTLLATKDYNPVEFDTEPLLVGS